MNPKQRIRYHATSKDMHKELIGGTQYWLEHNPNIGMWRLNRRGGVALELAGYSPHKQALMDKAMKA